MKLFKTFVLAPIKWTLIFSWWQIGFIFLLMGLGSLARTENHALEGTQNPVIIKAVFTVLTYSYVALAIGYLYIPMGLTALWVFNKAAGYPYSLARFAMDTVQHGPKFYRGEAGVKPFKPITNRSALLTVMYVLGIIGAECISGLFVVATFATDPPGDTPTILRYLLVALGVALVVLAALGFKTLYQFFTEKGYAQAIGEVARTNQIARRKRRGLPTT